MRLAWAIGLLLGTACAPVGEDDIVDLEPGGKGDGSGHAALFYSTAEDTLTHRARFHCRERQWCDMSLRFSIDGQSQAQLVAAWFAVHGHSIDEVCVPAFVVDFTSASGAPLDHAPLPDGTPWGGGNRRVILACGVADASAPFGVKVTSDTLGVPAAGGYAYGRDGGDPALEMPDTYELARLDAREEVIMTVTWLQGEQEADVDLVDFNDRPDGAPKEAVVYVAGSWR
jgi:hypothetical protein